MDDYSAHLIVRYETLRRALAILQSDHESERFVSLQYKLCWELAQYVLAKDKLAYENIKRQMDVLHG
jgi:hypothetical protein